MPTEFVMLPPQSEKTREWGTRLAAALPELEVIVAEDREQAAKALVEKGITPPGVDPAHHRVAVTVRGEPPSPIDPPAGCVFASRCPYATELCVAERPVLRELGGIQVACHHAEAIG